MMEQGLVILAAPPRWNNSAILLTVQTFPRTFPHGIFGP